MNYLIRKDISGLGVELRSKSSQKELKQFLMKRLGGSTSDSTFEEYSDDYPSGNTLLLQAIQWKCVDSVKLILDSGNGISINSCDFESNYSPLHKAILYPCSLSICFALLNMNNCNLLIKDYEGLDWIDLFYSTIKLPKVHLLDDNLRPSIHDSIEMATTQLESTTFDDHNNTTDSPKDDQDRTDETNEDTAEDTDLDENTFAKFTAHSISMSLWSWGSNCNYLLGYGGHAESRLDPDLVLLINPKSTKSLFSSLLSTDLQIQMVAMSKYHTLVLANYSVYVYGLGNGGRLGTGDEGARMSPCFLDADFGKVVAVSVGNDHSLALDERGRVFAWGWNRYGQVGIGNGVEKVKEPVELQSLKRVAVKGIAASKYHSAAFSDSGAVYTWGTNHGQLGYESTMQPLPKKVIAFSPQPILQISATTSSTLILTKTHVYAILNNTLQRLTFPSPPPLLQQSRPSRPPTAIKLTPGGGIILSNGDVALFTAPDPICKLVWRARKKHTSAISCAVDGTSLMIVTDRGHVYKSTQGKFLKMKGLEHVSSVAASDGSYIAVRSDYRCPAECRVPDGFARDFAAAEFCEDVFVNGVGVDCVVLAARCGVLENVVGGEKDEKGEGWSYECEERSVCVYRSDGEAVLEEAVVLLVDWMYCAKISVPWPTNFRIQAKGQQEEGLRRLYEDFKRVIAVLKLDVDENLLEYPTAPSLASKTSLTATDTSSSSNCDSRIPSPPLSLVESSSRVSDSSKVLSPSPLFLEKLVSLTQFCNVAVSTSDGIVECHQVVLSSRSGFFKGHFRGDWSQGYTSDNKKLVELPQTNSAMFRQVYRHLLHPCTELFSDDFGVAGKEEWIESIKQLQALADELLVPNLVEHCSIVLGRFITIQNVFGILDHAFDIGLGSKVMGLSSPELSSSSSVSETPSKKKKKKSALLYHSNHLTETCLDFIIRNLETFLKNRTLQKLSAIVVQAVQDKIQLLQAEKLPFMFGPDGYYTQLAALEELQRREQKEERRMRFAAGGGEEKGKNAIPRQFSDESFLTVNGSNQILELGSPPPQIGDISEPEDNLSPIIPAQPSSFDPASRLFKREDRTTSAMSFSTAVLSPMLNAEAESDGVSPILNHSGSHIVSSSMEDFRLDDGDEHWIESRRPRRKNSSKRSSLDLGRKPPFGSASGSPGYASSFDHYAGSPRASSIVSTPNEPGSPFVSSKSGSVDISPFTARLSATIDPSASHRFLGSGIKLVRQLSTSVVKEGSSVKSQLSAKFSPLKPTLSNTGSPVLAPQTSSVDSSYGGIQIKTATKLSQRERKRLSVQNAASSGPSPTTTPSKPAPAWGIPSKSSVSSASKLSLDGIQQQESILKERQQLESSFTPTKTTRWSLDKTTTFMGNICIRDSPTPPSPTFAASPIVSLRNIQQQQTQAKLVQQKVKSKTIAQIQAEESAIRELSQFYKDTRAPGSNEWISVERKVRLQ